MRLVPSVVNEWWAKRLWDESSSSHIMLSSSYILASRSVTHPLRDPREASMMRKQDVYRLNDNKGSRMPRFLPEVTDKQSMTRSIGRECPWQGRTACETPCKGSRIPADTENVMRYDPESPFQLQSYHLLSLGYRSHRLEAADGVCEGKIQSWSTEDPFKRWDDWQNNNSISWDQKDPYHQEQER